jgi:hypothetical protein
LRPGTDSVALSAGSGSEVSSFSAPSRDDSLAYSESTASAPDGRNGSEVVPDGDPNDAGAGPLYSVAETEDESNSDAATEYGSI